MRPLGSCLLLAALAVSARGDDGPVGVTFAGRVVEVESSQPIAGANVVVARSIPGLDPEAAPPFIKETTLTTDAEGRFTCTFTPEELAEPRLAIAIAMVTHPDYVPRKGSPVPLVSLLRGREFGDRPFFETITLERGQEFRGRVVTPEGKPAVDVPFEFENWGWGSNQSRHFANVNAGRTDAEGRFRLRMPKTQSLAITLTPEEYAPFRHFWGTAEPGKNPDVWAPTDLGTIAMEPGPVLKGRLLDTHGRPIAGQRVVAVGRQNRLSRMATTRKDGSFAFGPLRPGNYDVIGEGQGHGAYIDATARPMAPSAPVIRPARVYFKKGKAPEPVELRSLPTVRVTARFVDSRGKPGRGSFMSLSGVLPVGAGPAAGPVGGEGDRLASTINEEEPEDPDRTLSWGCQLTPDSEGRVVFRAPMGLENAVLQAFPPDETIAYKTRLGPDQPLKFWGGGRLGTLDADRGGIEVICYRAPTVLVTIRDEDGRKPVFDAGAHASFNSNGGDFGGNLIKQDDGRYRGSSLMPDHEYEFGAFAPGYVPNLIERVNLPEGASKELTLVLRKKPEPPRVGDPAPPLLVKTLDGPAVGLGDFRGRFLLLHAWFFRFGEGREDLGRLRQIKAQYQGDKRLAMLGLCLANDPADADGAIKAHRIDWPQAVLRDRLNDPIAVDYGLGFDTGALLIGPDGRIVARDLKGAQIAEALEKVLSKD